MISKQQANTKLSAMLFDWSKSGFIQDRIRAVPLLCLLIFSVLESGWLLKRFWIGKKMRILAHEIYLNRHDFD